MLEKTVDRHELLTRVHVFYLFKGNCKLVFASKLIRMVNLSSTSLGIL